MDSLRFMLSVEEVGRPQSERQTVIVRVQADDVDEARRLAVEKACGLHGLRLPVIIPTLMVEDPVLN